MYLNKAIIIGNLTRDPELRTMPNGGSVATFGMATNRVWKDQSGQKKEDTQFHNIVVFGKQADTVAQYLKKGSSVLVEGRMQTRSWDDKTSGEKKYRTEIVADRVQFGPRPSGSPSQSFGEAKPGETKEAKTDTIEYPQEEINPDDIPF